MRGFELVAPNHRLHPDADISCPTRKTTQSAGYDLATPIDFILQKGEVKLIMTDIKAHMQPDEVLYVYIRSSIGKKGVMLANSVGVVDADYYSNPSNDGNIGILLINHSDAPVSFKAQEFIAQGVFAKYLITTDDETESVRVGGFGSTNEGNKM